MSNTKPLDWFERDGDLVAYGISGRYRVYKYGILYAADIYDRCSLSDYLLLGTNCATQEDAKRICGIDNESRHDDIKSLCKDWEVVDE